MTLDTKAPATLPPGERIYAVGDVHGCDSRLARMHALIAADLEAFPAARPTLVHMGDYIDRGPDSAGVLSRLIAGSPVPGLPVVNLLGNHEAMLLDALDENPDAASQWLANGGLESLASWDVPPDSEPDFWRRMIPRGHQELMAGLALRHDAGGYVFVHAGVRPLVPLDRQEKSDLLWIREPFLSWTRGLGAVIVHGHTPVEQPAVRANRIGIDTGAVMGGRLTCLVLEADRLGFLQA
jgi:serine/threonine protein phosphatase 1